MNNATTIIIIAVLCLFVCTIFIYKINHKYNNKPTKEKRTEKEKAPPPPQLTVNSRGVPTAFGNSDSFIKFFGMNYKPNQRKIRKRKRQNLCI